MSVTFSTDDYQAPEWSCQPRYSYHLEIIKEGSIMGNIALKKKPFILIGRVNDLCDLYIDNPSVSRKHAILQFKRGDDFPYLYDLGGTHGTYVNKKKLPMRAYQKLQPFDTIKFGLSSRYYILRCPELQHKQLQMQDEKNNNFLGILQERKKVLSKQQLKQKYLDMLQNDPYFKSNNLARSLQGSAKPREVNGVDWGIQDEFQVYNYRGDSDLQLQPDILRRLPGLQQPQLSKISEFQTIQSKYQQLQSQLNELSSKEKREFGLEEKLRDKKEKLEKRFVETLQHLDKVEDWIRVNVFGEMPMQVAKRKVNEKEGDSFDGDQFFDRTLKDKGDKDNKDLQGHRGGDGDMFTTQDFWKLEKELRSEYKNLIQQEKALSQLRGEQKKEGDEEQDDLDAYMKQNNDNLEKQQQVLYNSRMAQTLKKIEEIKQFLIPLIGEEFVQKIEKEERGIVQKGGPTQQQRRAAKEAENKRKIDSVLQQLDIIKEMEEEIDEEDVKIFDMYKGEEDEIEDEENYKRKRPQDLEEESEKVQKPKVKMYPVLKDDRDRDKYESDQDQGKQKYFDLTKLS